MAKKDISISEKSEYIADLIGDNFLRLAKALRELKDEFPEHFIEVVNLIGLSHRKAYALARISRQFDDIGVPEGRLYSIGWSKLQIVGRYLTSENCEHLLQLAESHTAHDLQTILRGETPVEDARVVLLYLPEHHYMLLRSVLLKHGALVNGNGLINKEEALVSLLKAYQN